MFCVRIDGLGSYRFRRQLVHVRPKWSILARPFAGFDHFHCALHPSCHFCRLSNSRLQAELANAAHQRPLGKAHLYAVGAESCLVECH
jgi:hypothetical protein